MKTLLKADKLMHLIAGLVITQILFIILCTFANKYLSVCIAAIISVFVMLGKEVVWDKWLGKGTPNIMDFCAGCIGIGAEVILLILTSLTIK